MKHLEKARRKLPRSPDVLYHLAKAQAAQGLRADAAGNFEMVLLLDPQYEHAEEIQKFLSP